jgi:hypothetical protein
MVTVMQSAIGQAYVQLFRAKKQRERHEVSKDPDNPQHARTLRKLKADELKCETDVDLLTP